MSENTVKAQQCLRAFVDGNYDESLSLIDQVEEPHKLKDDKYGATLLHWAATRGWLNIVQQLLDKYDFHPMCKRNDGATPLPCACERGHLDVVQYLITECKSDPMCKTNDGATPVHAACYNGHLNVVQYLITECKCDPMCKDHKGNTPLDSASRNGQFNVVKYLIIECKCDPMCKNNNGFFPLHSACQNGHLDVVRYLTTECNCDPTCKSNKDVTPLHSACQNGHLNVAQYLITMCKCDPMCTNHKGNTPLHSASRNGHLNVVQYLITECKCDPMCTNNKGLLPLHSACQNGHLNVVQYLITECNCDPTCKSNKDVTPLHSACQNGHLDVVKYLITKCKCDPMCRNMIGDTPLHSACENSHPPVIEYLLSSGRVDPETRNMLFRKPSYSANHDVLKVLAKFNKLKTCFSVDSYVNVVLLGNPGTGKSTLAQVIIQTSSGRHVLGRFQNVKAVELHTAGIVPTRIEHQRLGNIILHDLAGQSEYYSSHIAVLENLLQDYPAVFINFVNLCEEEEEVLKSLHKWITVIENVSQNVSSHSHVVTIASHVDMINQSEFSRVNKEILESLSSCLDSSNVVNAGLVGLDCRKLGGGDFSPFIITLSNCCQTIRSAKSINPSVYCRMLYTFLENERKIVHRVDQLCYRIMARKISENYYLPETQEDVLETLPLFIQLVLLHF